MKTTKYFFLLLTITILASCSKEDAPSTEHSLIVGEWNLEEYTYSGTTTATQGGSTMTTSYIGELYDIDMRLILNSDNTYRTEGSYMVKLTSTVEGQSFVENRAFNDIVTTGTYRIEDNKLITGDTTTPQQPGSVTMTVDEGTILELTENRLVLGFVQDFNSGMEGAQVNISVEGQQVYSR